METLFPVNQYFNTKPFWISADSNPHSILHKDGLSTALLSSYNSRLFASKTRSTRVYLHLSGFFPRSCRLSAIKTKRKRGG